MQYVSLYSTVYYKVYTLKLNQVMKDYFERSVMWATLNSGRITFPPPTAAPLRSPGSKTRDSVVTGRLIGCCWCRMINWVMKEVRVIKLWYLWSSLQQNDRDINTVCDDLIVRECNQRTQCFKSDIFYWFPYINIVFTDLLTGSCV